MIKAPVVLEGAFAAFAARKTKEKVKPQEIVPNTTEYASEEDSSD